MLIQKDPVAELDFGVNWAPWLGGDTISNSAFTVPAGITKVSESNTTTVSTVWLGGGTAGAEYKIGVQITTVGGRTERRVFTIYVREHY